MAGIVTGVPMASAAALADTAGLLLFMESKAVAYGCTAAPDGPDGLVAWTSDGLL